MVAGQYKWTQFSMVGEDEDDDNRKKKKKSGDDDKKLKKNVCFRESSPPNLFFFGASPAKCNALDKILEASVCCFLFFFGFRF